MVVPTQIAVFDATSYDGTSPEAGNHSARILDIGAGTGGTYTLTGVDIAAGTLAVPLMPVPVVVTGPLLTVENIDEEPVITTTSEGNLTVIINSGPYAGTYTQRVTDNAPVTVGMVEAAPTPLTLPAISGTVDVGETLTVTPTLWLYAGPDPGDATFAWQNDADGPTGETSTTYVIQLGDITDTLSIDETFGGVTVSSASTTVVPGTIDPNSILGADLLQWWSFRDSANLFQNTDGTGAVTTNGDRARFVTGLAASGAMNLVSSTGTHTWNSLGHVDNTANTDAATDGWVTDAAFNPTPDLEVFALIRTTDNKWLMGESAWPFGGYQFGGAEEGSAFPAGTNLNPTPNYTVDNVAITAASPPIRDNTHDAWSTGAKLVAGAQNIGTPSQFDGRAIHFLQSKDGGMAFVGEIYEIVVAKTPLTAKKRADLQAWFDTL